MRLLSLILLFWLPAWQAQADLLLSGFSGHDLDGRFELSFYQNTNTAVGQNPGGLSWTLYEAGSVVPGRITVTVPGSGPSQITAPQFWSSTVSGSGLGGSEITWTFNGTDPSSPFESFSIDQTSLADGPLNFSFVSGLSVAQLTPGTSLPLNGSLSGVVTIPGFGNFSGAESFVTQATAVPEPSSFILFAVVLLSVVGRSRSPRSLER